MQAYNTPPLPPLSLFVISNLYYSLCPLPQTTLTLITTQLQNWVPWFFNRSSHHGCRHGDWRPNILSLCSHSTVPLVYEHAAPALNAATRQTHTQTNYLFGRHVFLIFCVTECRTQERALSTLTIQQSWAPCSAESHTVPQLQSHSFNYCECLLIKKKKL